MPFVKYFFDILYFEGNDWENDGINIRPRDNTDSAISIFRAKLSRRWIREWRFIRKILAKEIDRVTEKPFCYAYNKLNDLQAH